MGQYQIRFGQDLGIAEDLRLSGATPSAAVRFYCESQWKPVAGSSLHLFIAHSPELDGDRSFLSVSLNYGLLRSLRLDSQNAQTTEVVVNLPPNLLKTENQLVFSATQHARVDERAPLMTSIRMTSYIVVQYQETDPQLDLSLFPAPFADARSYRSKRVSLLLPQTASSETLEANALLVANLCRRSHPRQLQVSVVQSVQNAKDSLLIVGTPAEQPQLEAGTEMKIQRTAKRSLIEAEGGGGLGEFEGVVGVTARPGPSRIPVLFVTGNSPQAVLKAARTLLAPGQALKGRFATITQEPSAPRESRRSWSGYIPPRSRFTLADLASKAVRLAAGSDQPLRLELPATPDARFLEHGHRMTLNLQLSAEAIPASSLEVFFNDSLLKKYTAREIFRGRLASVNVEVPAELLKSANFLKLVYQVQPPAADGGAELELLPNSEFYLPREYETKLPDLSLLQHRLYPFSLNPALADSTILLPDAVSADLFVALLELSCTLGKMVPSDHLGFHVRRAAEVSSDLKGASNFIVLNVDAGGLPTEQLFLGWTPPPWIEGLKGAFTIQTWLSSWNREKSVLQLAARSPAALVQGLSLCFSDRMLRELKGDAAYVTPNGAVSLRMSQPRRFEERSYLTRLEAWLRVHWIALPIILALASGILFVGLRLALGHYRRGREAAAG
jgi:hypothetical protein